MSELPRRKKKVEGLTQTREVMDESAIAQALRRVADQILARHPRAEDVVLVGVRTCGAFLARRLRGVLKDVAKVDVPLGVIDITLYRDDVFEGLPRPEVGSTSLPGPIDGKIVILVDDVLFTGRTIRSGLDALMDYGRPRSVELAVLVDRGRRELPIHADFVGTSVPTTPAESVHVSLSEEGEEDRVVLYEKAGG
jgi:pyrimidine operon attenuation protein/uracil phosphoribosyltransferase